MSTTTPDSTDRPKPARRAPIRREGRAQSRIEVAAVSREPAFASAARHTRRVRALRVVLPVLALGAAATAFIAARSGTEVDLPMAFAELRVDPAAIVIEEPRLTGYQEGGEAYELTADRGFQRADAQDLLLLENVTATYELPGGATAFFTAPIGAYNALTSFMTLSGGLTMRLDTGLEARLEEITVDVPNGLISSNRPFELRNNNLTVRGNAIEMREEGILVTGGVTTIIRVEGATGEPAPPTVAP